MRNENDDLAVGVSRIHAMHTSLFTNHQISCFDRSQNIANYSISLLIRNDYDLTSTINKLIRGVLEGGLNIKWQRENTKPIPPEVGDISCFGYTFTPLKVEVFPIILYFAYLPFIFVATCILFLERLTVSKIKQSQTAENRRFWMSIDKLLDNRRRVFKLKSK